MLVCQQNPIVHQPKRNPLGNRWGIRLQRHFRKTRSSATSRYPNQCILPEEVSKLARLKILQTVSPDSPPKERYAREDTILIKGTNSEVAECERVVSKLPSTLAPSQVYLLAIMFTVWKERKSGSKRISVDHWHRRCI